MNGVDAIRTALDGLGNDAEPRARQARRFGLAPGARRSPAPVPLRDRAGERCRADDAVA